MTKVTSVTSSLSRKGTKIKAKIGGVITGNGDAASTVQSQGSAQKCCNEFEILKGLPSLNETPVESFCTETFHRTFAWYLVLEYKSSRGEACLMRGTQPFEIFQFGMMY